MKRIQNIMLLTLSVLAFLGCKNQYMADYYVKPEAKFSMNILNNTVNTLESVIFTNKGAGQTFAIWTGDVNHVYGKQANTGFAIGTSGVFSYSYREPGAYTVVWVASSTNAEGKIEQSIDSVHITVVDNTSGIDNLSIYKIYRMSDYDASGNTYYEATGEFYHDTILCPIIYEAWRSGTVNTIKSKKLYLRYQLTSPTASLYCYQQDWTLIRSMTDNIFCVMNGDKIALQPLKVVTGSGSEHSFQLAAVMMPKLTSFSINGVAATITHDVSAYNIYDVNITLPVGTDLSQLKPEWVLMENDANLLDGTNARVQVNGIDQVSGTSVVDCSKGDVVYDLYYQMLGVNNANMSQTSQMIIHVQTAQ